MSDSKNIMSGAWFSEFQGRLQNRECGRINCRSRLAKHNVVGEEIDVIVKARSHKGGK